MAVSPKRLSYFLYCECDTRDRLKYICDISVFIFQVVSQCDAESVTGRKEDWPQ